jgi:hypothetical protein
LHPQSGGDRLSDSFLLSHHHINMTYSPEWYMLNKGRIMEKHRAKKQLEAQRKKEECHFEIIYGTHVVTFCR